MPEKKDINQMEEEAIVRAWSNTLANACDKLIEADPEKAQAKIMEMGLRMAINREEELRETYPESLFLQELDRRRQLGLPLPGEE